MASETIAPDFPIIPANNLNTDKSRLTTILTVDTCIATFLVFSSDKISFFSILVITNPLSLITMLSLIKYDFFGTVIFL